MARKPPSGTGLAKVGEMNLVAPTAREKLLEQLEKLKKNGLNTAEREKLAHQEKRLVSAFIALCEKRGTVGISKDDLRKLIKRGYSMQELDNLIAHKIKWPTLLQATLVAAPFGVCIASAIYETALKGLSSHTILLPLLGMTCSLLVLTVVGAITDGDYLNYFWYRSRIRKVFGKDYFPIERLIQYIQ